MVVQADAFASRLAPTFEMHSPVGASLLAKGPEKGSQNLSHGISQLAHLLLYPNQKLRRAFQQLSQQRFIFGLQSTTT
jgi:hypothetical protein